MEYITIGEHPQKTTHIKEQNGNNAIMHLENMSEFNFGLGYFVVVSIYEVGWLRNIIS